MKFWKTVTRSGCNPVLSVPRLIGTWPLWTQDRSRSGVINAAMIGGIAANNASGMCCGTAQNSYKTISSLQNCLEPTVLCWILLMQRVATAFASTHKTLLNELIALGKEVRANLSWRARIRHKFKIKNTMGSA